MCRWNEQFMLVQDIQFFRQIEKFVPSQSTVCAQSQHCGDKACAASEGASIFQGLHVSGAIPGKGKLDTPPFSVAHAMGGDDLPIGMVQSGPKVVNDVPTPKRHFVYYDLILFDEEESFIGFSVCLNNERKWPSFQQKFVKFTDVLFSLTDLEESTVCHF